MTPAIIRRSEEIAERRTRERLETVADWCVSVATLATFAASLTVLARVAWLQISG